LNFLGISIFQASFVGLHSLYIDDAYDAVRSRIFISIKTLDLTARS